MNKAIVIGNLTKDIELRKTKTGKSVAQFTLAVNDFNNTEFIDCVAWEKNAELLEKFTSKGNKLLVEGKIKSNKYEGQNGTVKKTFVEVYSFEFLTPKAKPDTDSVSTNQESNNSGYLRTHNYSEKETTYTNNVSIEADDLPFF